MSNYERTFIELIQNNKQMMNDLAIVRDLKLPNWYIAAGYVRNYIWDYIHGYEKRTPLNDIDVIYYNPEEIDEEIEKHYEQLLIEKTGNPAWSVKNQARMHIKNGNRPYASVEDAISHWPETVTAVAIRLDGDNKISYLCPYGLDDIFECRVRKSPLFTDEVYYQTRIKNKNWQQLWPKLKILFTVNILDIQPSQLYINEMKVERLKDWFSVPDHNVQDPLPVLQMGHKIVVTDGHTRLFNAMLHNINEIHVYWDEDELDLEAYRIYVHWCEKEGIQNITQLKTRVINHEEYQVKWIHRCQQLQQQLDSSRKTT